MENLKYIFGPVPSRRLGRSLGINAVPAKICSMNCLYCEVGKTNALSVLRKPYIKAQDILSEFDAVYDTFKNNIDVITITGAGEPTLNSELPKILEGIKKRTNIPVALLTNSTMFNNQEVFSTLLNFDIVVPSLDGADDIIFQKINLPHESVSISSIIDNLTKFSHEYKGQLYLEVLFCAGVNDTPESIELIANAAVKIQPAKVQVGTLSRPPAFGDTKKMSDEAMLHIAKIFTSKGLKTEITGCFKDVFKNSTSDADLPALISSLLKMRPCTVGDMVAVFGESGDKIKNLIDSMKRNGSVEETIFNDDVYYAHPSIGMKK